MGLLDSFGLSSNPAVGWFDQNRNSVGSAFGGLVGASNLHDALGGWTNGINNTQAGLADASYQQAIEQQQKEAEAVKAQQDQQAQQIEWLKQNAPPQIAAMVANGMLKPEDAGKLLSTPNGGSGAADPASVAEYKFYANQEILAHRQPLPYGDWRKGANQTVRAGMGQPIWGKNRKTGEYMPFEPMSDGTISSLVDQNANPADFLFDPGTVASDRAAGTAFGTGQGTQQYNQPKVAQDIETELGNIDALLANTTGMDQSFGNLGGFNIGGVGFPNQWTPPLPNTPRAGFDAQLKQVAGENFLSAYATLRGAGAITENEGQAAKEAMARLSTAQSKEDFTKALGDLKALLVKGYKTYTSQTAGGAYQSTGYQPPPLAGQNYQQKYGLE